jgi:hypothetical protein
MISSVIELISSKKSLPSGECEIKCNIYFVEEPAKEL